MRDRALLAVPVLCVLRRRGIVEAELRASGDARRQLGVSGFPREENQGSLGGRAAI